MDDEDRKCRVCGTRVASSGRLTCNHCKHEADKLRWRENYENYVNSRVRIARSRATKFGFPFDIDKHYILELLIEQDYRCSVTGLPFTRTGEMGDYDLSIDRVDSDKGYEKGNVALVCNRVNFMKNTMPQEMFIWWCKTIANYDQDRRSRKKT